MKDLFVRRAYTHPNGITIVAEIDYIKKTVSLVEKDGSNKKWVFAERTPEYLNGWRLIMVAMDWAVEQIKEELDKVSETEHEQFVAMYMELDKALKKGGK